MNERRKTLSCACCGSDAGKWKQFSNQDAGWGLCRKCAAPLLVRAGRAYLADKADKGV